MSVTATDARSVGRAAWLPALLVLAAGAAAALTETLYPSIVGLLDPPIDLARLALGALGFCLALDAANRGWRLPWQQPWFALVLAFAGCVAAGWLGGVAWPNSGDEFSYLFLTDTFRAFRLWNPAPPDPALFANFHVLVKDGRTFSPYPPAWSLLLLPFRTLGMVWLANPLATMLLGATFLGAGRRLGLRASALTPALALALLMPFTLFLGGSLFPQTVTAALVTAIAWAQIADEARPRLWRKLMIGGLFGGLLLIRYDVFAIAALVYGVDRLVRRRLGAVADGVAVMLGLLPFAAALLAYNAAITGHPLQLTATWAAPDAPAAPGLDPLLLALRPVLFNVYWLGSLAEFGGLPILVLALAALALKWRHRTCRWHDWLLPAALAFCCFLPFTGGHQYGPRYWFWAMPPATLTLVTGLLDTQGRIAVFGRRVSFEGFAAACLVYAAAAFCVLLPATAGYIDARREVYAGPPPPGPAVVLLPDRALQRWWWPRPGIPALNLDFTRNDIDFRAPVLYGRGDLPDARARACRLPGRKVFAWTAPGHLLPETCP